MEVIPLTIKQANEFIEKYHRHHKKVIGAKFCIGALKNSKLVGVSVVGRPKARMLDNKLTAEITRLCTDGSKNACSFLYSASARIAKEMGYFKIITYILISEKGISLNACGWKNEGVCGGGSWNRKSRIRKDKHPIIKKIRWSKQLKE